MQFGSNIWIYEHNLQINTSITQRHTALSIIHYTEEIKQSPLVHIQNQTVLALAAVASCSGAQHDHDHIAGGVCCDSTRNDIRTTSSVSMRLPSNTLRVMNRSMVTTTLQPVTTTPPLITTANPTASHNLAALLPRPLFFRPV